jgi:ABC-type multidrug transport system ATPase subunit
VAAPVGDHGTSALVELAGVTKRYSRWEPAALAEVSLTLPPAQVLAVVGPNGSGKTTLLRLIVGATSPSKGQVRRRARVVGYVPERFPATVPFTAAEYLAHMGQLRGLSVTVLPGRIDELVDRLGLRQDTDRQIAKLSKGARRKVAIAQALLTVPDLLVLDEPWSGLDAAAQAMLTTSLDEVAASGGSVVFTDHREAIVQAVAHRVVGLDGGRLQGDGPAWQPTAGTVRIEVDCPNPSSAAERVRQLPGVLGVRPEQLGLRVDATAANGDAVLGDLLGLGASVRRVERLSGGDQETVAS